MKNLVFITGRLARDCEIQYFESGKIKATFTLAVDSYINKEKFTSFINCEIWDKKAEFAGEYFKKGKVVSVFGELTSNTYKDKVYRTINCRTANFVNSQIVVKGAIHSIGEKSIKIQVGNDLIEAECYLKDLNKDIMEYTFILNFGMKDYNPVYSVVAILD